MVISHSYVKLPEGNFSNLGVISKGGHDMLFQHLLLVPSEKKLLLRRKKLDNLGILKIPRPSEWQWPCSVEDSIHKSCWVPNFDHFVPSDSGCLWDSSQAGHQRCRACWAQGWGADLVFQWALLCFFSGRAKTLGEGGRRNLLTFQSFRTGWWCYLQLSQPQQTKPPTRSTYVWHTRTSAWPIPKCCRFYHFSLCIRGCLHFAF